MKFPILIPLDLTFLIFERLKKSYALYSFLLPWKFEDLNVIFLNFEEIHENFLLFSSFGRIYFDWYPRWRRRFSYQYRINRIFHIPKSKCSWIIVNIVWLEGWTLRSQKNFLMWFEASSRLLSINLDTTSLGGSIYTCLSNQKHINGWWNNDFEFLCIQIYSKNS